MLNQVGGEKVIPKTEVFFIFMKLFSQICKNLPCKDDSWYFVLSFASIF